jgi:hypothetical protein
VIIVDNNSLVENFNELSSQLIKFENTKECDEDSIGRLKFSGEFKTLLIKSNKNYGFSGGNNLGIKVAQNQKDFEGVVLLNNDTIVHEKFLNKILSFRVENPNAHIIGGRIFHEDDRDKIWYDGGSYNRYLTRPLHINHNKIQSHKNNSSKPKITNFITGCLMYISNKCLSDIGCLNDSFFMYNEDLEYCLRAKKNGYLLYYVPDSIVWHKIGASSGEGNSSFSAYWIMRNRIKVSKIYGSWLTRFTTLLFIFISRVPMFLFWTFNNRFDIVVAQLNGLKDGLYLKSE